MDTADFEAAQARALLADGLDSFMAQHPGPARIRRVRESGSGIDPAFWKAAAEAGWFGLRVPEPLGGSGLGLAELAVMMHALGRNLAPEPVAAPTVARTYLVFFDWDRADLTDRARQIIGEAADASRTVQTTRIEVQGHADRAGTPEYNMRLSRRRADTVAAELVRQGVARGIITIEAFGESRPLVPTADGVREPQNRRVEIILR